MPFMQAFWSLEKRSQDLLAACGQCELVFCYRFQIIMVNIRHVHLR